VSYRMHAAVHVDIDPYTTLACLRRTVGMFEQNNVGVQMKSPLAECVEKMVAPGSAVDPAVSVRMLEATQCILDNIDGASLPRFRLEFDWALGNSL
jgi:hypothetical protein